MKSNILSLVLGSAQLFYSTLLRQQISYLGQSYLKMYVHHTYFAKSQFCHTKCGCGSLFSPIFLLCFSTFFTSRGTGFTISANFFNEEIIKFSLVMKILITEMSNYKKSLPYRKGGDVTTCLLNQRLKCPPINSCSYLFVILLTQLHGVASFSEVWAKITLYG